MASVGSWLEIWERLVLNDDSSVCPVAGRPEPHASPRDYDADNDGLIEITNLAQLDVMRHNLNGDGTSDNREHAAAFPIATASMGYPAAGCSGYELVTDLDFDANGNGNGEVNTGDTYWNDGSGWLSIGARSVTFGSRENKPFLASFHGNDHTISNLYIARNGTDYRRLSRGERVR